MAEEIVQQLGFSIIDALSALERMDTALGNFGANLDALAQKIVAWNTTGAAMVTVLKDIGSNATSAADAVRKLNAAMNMPQNTPAPQNAPKATPDQREAAKIFEQTRTAEERHAATIGRLGSLLQTGALNQDTYNRALSQANDKLDEATRRADKFIVSWQTLGRVVMTQAIVRALSALRNAVHEAFSSFMRFQTQAAEIQSIMPGVADGLDTISRKAASLAVEFNIPLAQVAEAQYQTLSDQFITTAEQCDVMTAAFKLAKVGVMDAGAAVSLITGALNAYRMRSEEATYVAALFRGTIEQGRVRGEELVATLGKVFPIAAELKVSLEELTALTANLTIGGIKPAESATALRSAMMSMLKPTQELKKELRELGYESGAQMVSALGLEGTFLKLRESADENVAVFARYLANVRGLTGALRASADGGVKQAEVLKMIRDKAVETFEARYKLFIASDAQKTLAEINKLKVFLTTDLGASVSGAVAKMLGFVGGAEALIAIIKGITPVAVAATAALGVYATVVKAIEINAQLAAGKNTLLAMSLQSVGAALALYSVYGMMQAKLDQQLDATLRHFEKTEKDKIDAALQAAQARLQVEDYFNQETVRKAEQAVAETRKKYFGIVDNTKDANKSLSDSVHATVLKITEEAEKEVHVLRNLAKEADSAVVNSIKQQAELRGRLADEQFQDQNRLLSQQEQVEALQRRAWQLAQQAAESMARAKTPQDVELAQSQFKRAEADAQSAKSLAGRLRDTLALTDSERVYHAVLRQEIASQDVLQRNRKAQAAEAAAAAAAEEQRVTRMRELTKAISADMSLFNKKGEPLSRDQREQAVAKLNADIRAFDATMSASRNWNIGQWINFESLKQQMRTTAEGAVTQMEVQELRAAPEALLRLHDRITNDLGPILVEIEPILRKKFTAEEIAKMNIPEAVHEAGTIPRETADRYKMTREEVNSVTKALQSMSAAQRAVLGQAAQYQVVGSSLWQRFSESVNAGFGLGGRVNMEEMTVRKKGDDITEAKSAYERIKDAVVYLSEHPLKINTENLKQVQEAVGAWKSERPWSLSGYDKALDTYLEKMKEIFELQEQLNVSRQKFPDLPKSVQESGVNMDELNKQFPEGAKRLKEMSDSANALPQAINNAVSAAASLVDQLVQAAQMWQMVGSMSAGEEMTAAHGGMAFLAGGGRPRGTDVIPAMLSPGEMVMSAKSVRQFAGQLTAMNAGVRPSQHYAAGGHTTNVGDIHVVVQGGGTGVHTARTIAHALRREMRRGTAVL